MQQQLIPTSHVNNSQHQKYADHVTQEQSTPPPMTLTAPNKHLHRELVDYRFQHITYDRHTVDMCWLNIGYSLWSRVVSFGGFEQQTWVSLGRWPHHSDATLTLLSANDISPIALCPHQPFLPITRGPRLILDPFTIWGQNLTRHHPSKTPFLWSIKLRD